MGIVKLIGKIEEFWVAGPSISFGPNVALFHRGVIIILAPSKYTFHYRCPYWKNETLRKYHLIQSCLTSSICISNIDHSILQWYNVFSTVINKTIDISSNLEQYMNIHPNKWWTKHNLTKHVYSRTCQLQLPCTLNNSGIKVGLWLNLCFSARVIEWPLFRSYIHKNFLQNIRLRLSSKTSS